MGAFVTGSRHRYGTGWLHGGHGHGGGGFGRGVLFGSSVRHFFGIGIGINDTLPTQLGATN